MLFSQRLSLPKIESIEYLKFKNKKKIKTNSKKNIHVYLKKKMLSRVYSFINGPSFIQRKWSLFYRVFYKYTNIKCVGVFIADPVHTNICS